MRAQRAAVAVAAVLLAAGCDGGVTPAASTGSTGSTVPTSTSAESTSSSVVPVAAPTRRVSNGCVVQHSRLEVMGVDLRVPPMRALVAAFDDVAGVAVHPVGAGLSPAAQRLELQASLGDGAGSTSPFTGSTRVPPDLAQIDLPAVEALEREGLLAAGALSDAVDADVPAGLIGGDGQWVAPWLSAVAFVVIDAAVADDAMTIPTSFTELADARGLTVALPGDPREDPAAFAAVMAASIASGGANDDLLPGVDYMARLQRQRRLVTGEADVFVELNDAAVVRRDTLAAAGIAATIVHPTDAVVAVPTVLAAPHGAMRPECAADWVRFVMSDEAAPVIAAAGLVPARWAAPGALRQHPVDERRDLPPADLWSSVHVLNGTAVALGREVLRDAWRDRVGTSH